MKKKQSKKFLDLPQYPGGKEAFQEFIKKNLIYPEEALKNQIEGLVHLSYEVNDRGEIIRPKVVKGIGYGCDEEALRLIKLLQYNKLHNKGLRVRSRMKAKILFKLPQKNININFNYSEPKSNSSVENSRNYTYTLKPNNQQSDEIDK